MAELTLKRHQRQAIRLNADKEVKKATDFLKAGEVDANKARVTVEKLKDYRSRLEILDNDINVAITDQEQAATEAQKSSDLDDILLDTSLSLSTKLESIQSEAVEARVVSSNAGSHHSGSGRGRISVQLPKLQLAKFSGDPLKFQEFWDSYESTIHTNDDLSDVDKFKYLRSFLTGDAFRLVDGYRLTSVNYQSAVEALTERFGNKQLAVFSHFEAMLALPVANYDTHQLQTVYDECEKHIRSLVALDLTEDTFGQVFTPIMLSKLPVFVKMELHRKNGSKPWTLANLRETLKEEIRARDMSHRTFGGVQSSGANASTRARFNSGSSGAANDGTGRSKDFGKHRFPPRSPPVGTASSLLSNDSNQRPQCSFCSGNHFSDQCTKYPDVPSRRSQMKGRCLICLSNRHMVKNCQVTLPCAYCYKTGHHRSLCYAKFGSKSPKVNHDVSLNVVENCSSVDAAPMKSSLLSHGETVILQTALVEVVGSGHHPPTKARILFDTGCSRSFITTALAKRMGARPRESETVAMAGFGDTKRRSETYKSVEFDVVLGDGRKKMLTANLVPTISCPIERLPLDVKTIPIISQIVLAEPLIDSPQLVTVDILMGLDYYYEFIGKERIECPNGVIFLSSTVGFIATGRVEENFGRKNMSSLLFSKLDPSPDTTLHVERYWSLEDIGVKSPSSTNDDEDALREFNNSVEFADGRYQVTLPFKADHPDLPDNLRLARCRLVSTLKRVRNDEKSMQQYNDTIMDQLAKGIIEEAPSDPDGQKVHYVPHHGVVTPHKATTKLRIVYDASAKAAKSLPSLNECLNRGPVMLDDLCGLLLRFRLSKVGLVSDIEKAFLQVGLKKASRDVTRFLWVRDTSRPPVGDNVVVYRFCRVPFGYVSSPFLLAAVIDHHVKKSSSSVADEINGNIYVDNVITGVQSTAKAVRFYHDAKQLFRDASMNLREWYSNSKEFLDIVKPEDQGVITAPKVLGLKWDTVGDTLSCASFDVMQTAVTTKRTMLKCLAKVFDPCGYFSAVTVSGKLLIQKLWKLSYNWDDKLPLEILTEWKECANSLQQISTKALPRCILPEDWSDNMPRQLHCFSDASAKAYAAVVYLTGTKSGKPFSELVFAKSRVGPTKQMSIPRMELMGVLVGIRIMAFVADQLRIEVAEKYLWCDSQCVLHWIANKSVLTKFVKNRVDEIKKHTSVIFRYVPTADNPADMSSRGCSFESISTNQLWWHGPQWLMENNSRWPPNPIPERLDDEDDDSSLIDDIENTNDTTMLPAVADVTEDSVPAGRFSSLTRLLRVTGWMLRFAKNAGLQHGSRQTGDLTASELATAEDIWNRKIQRMYFAGILDRRGDKRTMALVKQLGLFVDNVGVIRCGGRLENADLPYDAKYPKLLPKNVKFTELVIYDCHTRLFHGGVSHTLSQLRYKYWVVQGRSQVKRVVKSCRLCRFLDGGAYRSPPSPPLPIFRIEKCSPFTYTGVDYLGPLHVKLSVDGRTNKCWICLFTCAVTRAVHLEVMENLTAEYFLLGLRRFSAAHGAPTLIISDNAKHFHASDRFLHKLWCNIDRSVPEYCATHGVQWKFITELSPWMGGFYERMIGICKRALKKSLNNRSVSLVELQTLVPEVSAIINSRPLVYSGSDISAPPLTPAHFLGGFGRAGRLPSFEPEVNIDFVREAATAESLTKHWRRIDRVLNSFWSTWRSEYLLHLRSMKVDYFRDRGVSESSPTVGSIVVVRDDLPRSCWRMGRITVLHRSLDGIYRSATIRLSNGKSIKRAVRMLYPLEVEAVEAPTTEEPATNLTERPKRQAAVAARKNIADTADQWESSDSDQ